MIITYYDVSNINNLKKKFNRKCYKIIKNYYNTRLFLIYNV